MGYKPASEHDTRDPTIILGKAENCFVETWAERKQRLLTRSGTPGPAHREKLYSGGVPEKVSQGNYKLDAAGAKMFKQLWTDGAGVKYLAERFGIAGGTVHVWRRKLGLPMRYQGRSNKKKRVAPNKIVVLLTSEEKRAVGMRAVAQHGNMSDYIRSLIIRDLALNR